MNLPNASVGLGTSGIGDNFARTRLLMAKKAGYVSSVPGQNAPPGAALNQYMGAIPLLHQVAQSQGVAHGIPGLLRQGMLGRPPGQPMPPMQGVPVANWNSQTLGHSTGMLPFQFNAQPPIPGPQPNPMPPPGGIVGPIPPGQPMPPWTGVYPPGTIQNMGR